MAEATDLATIGAAAMKLLFRAEGGEQPEQEIPALPMRQAEWHPSAQRDGLHRESASRNRHGRQAVPPVKNRTPRGREAGMTRLYVGAGRDAGIRAGDLVGAIANEAHINSNLIGAIQIEERFSLVDVPESLAKGIVEVLGRSRIKGRKVGVRVFRE
jgi:ATP-dependent RNA helicase DeaD